jgi:hypothetical protein
MGHVELQLPSVNSFWKRPIHSVKAVNPHRLHIHGLVWHSVCVRFGDQFTPLDGTIGLNIGVDGQGEAFWLE